MIPVGVYKGGKLVEIIPHVLGKKIVRDCDRLVDLSHRPDIKLGHVWGTEPEGYGTAYNVIDDEVVPVQEEQSQ